MEQKINYLLILKHLKKTDIEIYAIEIEHDEYIKRIEAKQIEEIFSNVYGRYECYLN